MNVGSFTSWPTSSTIGEVRSRTSGQIGRRADDHTIGGSIKLIGNVAEVVFRESGGVGRAYRWWRTGHWNFIVEIEAREGWAVCALDVGHYRRHGGGPWGGLTMVDAVCVATIHHGRPVGGYKRAKRGARYLERLRMAGRDYRSGGWVESE